MGDWRNNVWSTGADDVKKWDSLPSVDSHRPARLKAALTLVVAAFCAPRR